MTPAQISTAFTQLYTRQAAQEFAEDLDRVRRAEDFGAGAVPLLIAALQQGASLFSADEQRRLVLAEKEDEEEKKKQVAGE
jgi:ribosome assembly protein 3